MARPKPWPTPRTPASGNLAKAAPKKQKIENNTMNSKDIRFRVGLFVLGSLALLAALITAFSGFPSIFKQYNRYTIVFPEAPGVSSGTPVRRSGVRIGEVTSIKLDDETGQVYVTIAVERQHILRHSDQAALVHGLLGG